MGEFAMYDAASKLVSKWLRNPLGGNFLHVSPISPYVSSCFTYCFPNFFWYLAFFPWCFSQFTILDLTMQEVYELKKVYEWKKYANKKKEYEQKMYIYEKNYTNEKCIRIKIIKIKSIRMKKSKPMRCRWLQMVLIHNLTYKTFSV